MLQSQPLKLKFSPLTSVGEEEEEKGEERELCVDRIAALETHSNLKFRAHSTLPS